MAIYFYFLIDLSEISPFSSDSLFLIPHLSFPRLTIHHYHIMQVGMVAINDGILLRNHVSRILHKHFKGKPYYVDLLDLFNEVIVWGHLCFNLTLSLLILTFFSFCLLQVGFQTICGQMLDLTTTHEGEEDLSKYTMPVYV